MKKIYLSLLLLLLSFAASFAQISLTATGGTTTGSYTTLKGAFDAINAGTHTGAIIILVNASTTETAICQLNSGDAIPASYTSILIKPTADGVTISGTMAAGRGLLELIGTDNITIDGDNAGTPGINRNLTLSNTAPAASTFTSVIRIATGGTVTSADNITIKNCNINGSAVGQNSSTASTTGAVQNTMGIFGGGGATDATSALPNLSSVNVGGGTMNNLIIDNNAINNCGRGMSINGSTQASMNVITVTNNIIGSAGTLTGTPPFTSPSSTVYTVGITIQGATTCNVIGNTMQNIMSYTTTAPVRGMEIQGQSAANINVQNNIINGVVANSTSTAQSAEGIYIGGTTLTCVINGNTISNLYTVVAGTSTAINMNSNATATNSIVSNNIVSKIYSNYTSTTAAPAIGVMINGGNNHVVQNNFISDLSVRAINTGTSQVNGIKINNGTGHKIYNNTIHLFGAQTAGTAAVYTSCINVVSTASTGLDIRNNILSNQCAGWPASSQHSCILFPSTAMTLTTINNNAYFAGTGNFVGQTGTTTYTAANFFNNAITPATNFRSVTSAMGNTTNDNASIAFSAAPPFVSGTNLHIPAATTTALESGGANVGLTTDIDGQNRPGPTGSTNGGATAPDMGADEFDGVPQDVVAPSITYTALPNGCFTTDRTVTVTITDNTGVPTSGALMPRIYFKKGAGSYFSAPGVLSSGTGVNGVWTFTISSAAMGGLAISDVVSYFVIAQDATPNIGASPFVGITATNVNSVTAYPTTPNTYTVLPTLSGTINVGVGQTYTTITAAANAYNNSCLSGNVVFQLMDATYPSETFPITFNANPSASATNNLTIKPKPATAVSVTGSASATSVFKLLNASYITFDGVNTGGATLTITGSNTTTNGDIWLAASAAAGNGCKFITIKNMNIVGSSNTTASSWGVIGCGDGSIGNNSGPDNDNITITGNTFTKVGYAVLCNGGTLTTNTDDNWTISGNTVGAAAYSTATNAGVNGMFFRNMTNLQITGNTLQNIGISTGTFGIAGFYLEGNINRAVVTNNIITNMSTSGTGTSMGIYLGFNGGPVINSIVSKNIITGVHNDNASSAGPMRCIEIQTDAAASNDTIVNNMISDVYGFGSATAANNPMGIDIENSAGTTGGVSVWHNTVNIFGPHTGSTAATGSYCMYVSATGPNLDIRNNIFSNTYDNTSSSTDKSYAIYTSSSVNPAQFTTLDYNDYYAAGGSNAFGSFGGTDLTTLTAIQTTLGGNTHSLTGQPTFYSNTDLHLAIFGGNVALASGAPIAAVTTDIYGTARSATAPLMGAHEVALTAIPPVMTFTALGNSCTTGDRTLTAVISDTYTGVPTTGALVPRIYFRKNTGAWFSRAGSLASGNSTSGTWNFTIASADMGGVNSTDVISYYLVSQTIAGNVGTNPFAGSSATSVNNVTVPPTTPLSYIVLPTSGTFDVGVGKTYTTITQAVNAYNNNTCLAGPIVYNLTDASYPSETYPIVINNNPLASASATLTIRPAPTVTVNLVGNATSMIKLLNARYVTIDGINAGGSALNITNNTSNGANIWLAASSAAGNGCNNIALKNIGIVGGGNLSTSSWGIMAGFDGTSPGGSTNGGDNDNVTVSNCSFSKNGYAIYSSGSVAAPAGANDNWVISNNLIGPAASGATDNIGVNGVFLRFMNNLEVSSNTFRNVGVTTSNAFGVSVLNLENGVTGARIFNNNFNNASDANTSSSTGIILGTNVINSRVSNNTFTTFYKTGTGGGGFRVIQINTGNAASNDTIMNNMISDVYGYGSATITNNTTGIALEGTTGGVNIWYNSINFAGPHTGLTGVTYSFPLYLVTSGNNIDLRNNIFVNTYDNSSSTTDKNYAAYITAAATQLTYNDYNDYYVTGTQGILSRFGATDYTTLAALQTATSSNTHSVNVVVPFVSATNLHVPAGTTSQIESGAVNIGVTYDYDNDARPGPAGSANGGATAPDMGADEFDGVIVDLVPPAITYTALPNSCNTADRIVTVAISDAKGVNNTTLKPRIYFKKGAGLYQSTEGTLSSGTAISGVWSFTISATAMGGVSVGDVVSYFVIAQDVATISNIGSMPGAGLVAANVNSVTTPPTNAYTYTVLNALSGTYNVGAGQTFASITAAVAAYNTSCVTGPVVFQLTDASYTTGETFPITINTNSFANATNTLTIRPAAGLAVNIGSATSSVAIFKLFNARYVTIDGVNTGGSSLTLTNNNTGANTCNIWLSSTTAAGAGNSFITLKNLNIIGGNNNPGPGNAAEWGIVGCGDGSTPGNNSTGADNDNITISNNSFIRCGYAVLTSGSAVTSAGANDNWVVSNNLVGPAVSSNTDNMGVNGMFFRNMVNLQITGNTLRNIGVPTSTSFGVAGLYLEAGINGARIVNNSISNMADATSGNVSPGLNMGTNVINAFVSGNKFTTLYKTTTSTGSVRAVVINTGNGSSNDTIVNNMISDMYTTNTNSGIASSPAGIDIEGSTGGIKLWNNTVNLAGQRPGSNTGTLAACIYIGSSTASNLDIRNNILSNTYDNTGTSTDKSYAIYSSAAAAQFPNMDYNEYYVNGTNVLAFIGSDRNTLAAVQAGFGNNTHSLTLAPAFVSATDAHLAQVDGNVGLIAGTPIPGVTTDIDGVVRSVTTPVIGAHEVSILPCGTVARGTIVAANPNLCVSGVTTLTLSGATAGSGISYQWQSSTDSVSWTAISGQTNMSYTLAAPITTSTYYRNVINCSISNLKDSSAIKVKVNPLPTINATPDGGAYCSGSNLNLSATGGISYTWAPATGLSATTGSVVNTNVGSTTVYTITGTDINGCVNTHVSTVTVTTTPPVPVITPSSGFASCSGSPITLSASVLVPGSVTLSSGSISVAIPDGDANGVATSLTVSSIPAGATITSIVVNFDINMTYVSDLALNLTAPNGNTLNLVNQKGGSGDNFTNTRVSSAGGITFSSSAAPFNNIYSADANTGAIGAAGYAVNATTFAALMSIPNGTWTFSGRDFFTPDPATITSWGLTINYTYPGPISWTPAIGMFTDAAMTIPYTGGLVSTVYTAPTTSSIAVNNTYTAVANNGGCTNTSSRIVSINPLPAAITGATTVCVGSSITLGDATTGGTWSSASSNVTVGAASGVVSGVTAGTATITYTLGTSCNRTFVVTVNPLPQPITGNADVCVGATNNLASNTLGGIWTSSDALKATVSNNGGLTGVAAGNATISYTLATGCRATVVATVNVLPVVAISPATNATICSGGNASFTASTSVSGVQLLSQDFESGLGAWTLTNGPAGTAAQFWQIVTPAVSGVPGDGSNMLYAKSNFSQDQTIVTSPAFSTLGYASANLTFNMSLLPDANDAAIAVEYTVDGGTTWQTLRSYAYPTPPINYNGTWSAGTPQESAALPADAIGVGNVQLRWHYDATSFEWAIDNIRVSAVPPAATYAWSGAAGLSCTACGTTTITPTALGANAYSVTATTSHNCMTTIPVTVSVNAMPTAISGTAAVCEQGTTQLGNTVAGGTWSTSSAANATVNTTGLVSGVLAGTATITYTAAGGCFKTVEVTVNTTPTPITGTTSVCTGSTTTLTESNTSGTWSSNVPTIASVDNGGIVTGIHEGTVDIYYSLSTGCKATITVTVSTTPSGISGTLAVCEGAVTNLGNTLTGGTWSSSSTVNATIDPATGEVHGVLAGTSTITYEMGTGCIATAVVTVNTTPDAITGIPVVCEGATTALADATAVGIWTSNNMTNATVNGIGVVSGHTAGTAIISYTLMTSCFTTTEVTVNPAPAAITGTFAICRATTTTLGNTVTGGTWTSSNPLIAAVDPATGEVNGLAGGNATITYTLPEGCTATAAMTVNYVSDVYSVTGTGSYCANGTGVVVGLSGSDTHIAYQLYDGTTAVGSPVAGTGSAISFGAQTMAATYSVVANADSSCPTNMSGSAVVTIDPLPGKYNVTGTGNYCSSTGGHVLLSGSDNDADVSYELYKDGTVVGTLTGTGSPLDFGAFTSAGSFTVHATNTVTGCMNDMDQVAVISITPTVVPAIAVSQDANPVVCNGTTVTFTASPVNGGSAPVYTWNVNGAVVGTTANTYSYIPVNGDVVKTVLHSNAACAEPDSAVTSVTMNVAPIITPSITIDAAPGNNVCKGTRVTFTSSSVNGGVNAEYTWVVNGTIVSTASSYSYVPQNEDIVYAMLTSHANCVTDTEVYSNNEVMVVDSGLIPIVNIKVLNGTYINVGQVDSFVAQVTNAGTNPTYKWFINGVLIPAATSNMFASGSLHNNDSVTVQVTNNGPCGYSTFNSVIIKVKTTGIAIVTPSQMDLRMVPNPNNGEFTVNGSLGTSTDETVNFEVTDMLGQVVYKGQSMARAGVVNEKIQVSNTLANGMYMLNVRTATDNKVFHFVLKQ